MLDDMEINVCVVGVGLAGLTFHIPFILALPHLFRLHSVLERNPAPPAGKVYARFGVPVKINSSLDEVLRSPEIDLVIAPDLPTCDGKLAARIRHITPTGLPALHHIPLPSKMFPS